MAKKTTTKKPSNKRKPAKPSVPINKVTPPQASMALKAAGLQKGKRKKQVVAASGNGKSIALNIEDIIQVKELAIKLGGLERLKETIAVYEELQRIWYAV